MKAKKYWILVAVLPICLAALLARGSSDNSEMIKETKRERLRGLRGIGLEVLGPGERFTYYGLTKKQIETDVELKLRQAGIKILSKEQLDKTIGYPLLVVWINGSVRDDLAQMSVEVEFKETVFLERNPEMSLHATTWSAWPPTKVVLSVRDLQLLRQATKDHVNEFINDYLAANPKEPAAKKDSIKKRK